MSGSDEGLKAAKDFVNEIRVKCGHRRTGKLKKGYPRSRFHCPIAIALECCGVDRVNRSMDGQTVVLYHKDERRVLTYKRPEVVRWMEDYDDGKYPELVIPPTPIKIKYPGDRKQTVIG